MLLYLYCPYFRPISVKFGIADLHVMRLSIYEFRRNNRREVHTFFKVQDGVTLTRAQRCCSTQRLGNAVCCVTKCTASYLVYKLYIFLSALVTLPCLYR